MTHRPSRVAIGRRRFTLAAIVIGATACVHHPSTVTAHRLPPFRAMADGRQWLTQNLRVALPGSTCYQDDEHLCAQYGRLYTWVAAQAGCRSLGSGWQLPTDADWAGLAALFGGIDGESTDSGQAAFQALVVGGRSGFGATLGGGTDAATHAYSRLAAHGFYWTATESAAGGATYMNFGGEGKALHRQTDGDKDRAFSVRCVRAGR